VKIAFGGGGTGGHVVPALAIANQLKLKNHETIFIGNANSIEERLSLADGNSFHVIRVQKLYRSLSIRNILFPYLLLRAVLTARSILNREKPDAVFCTGGFVSGPVAIAALLLHIPLFCHESNSYPGLVTRVLSKHFMCIYISFEASRKYLRNSRCQNFGIPIQAPQSSAFKLSSIGLDELKPIVMISGGSQGSFAINEAIDAALPELLEKGYQVLWQTGKATYHRFADKHPAVKGLYIFGFSPDLAQMLKHVDIAITRAGAMTIAELEENRIPSILIPLPGAAENHQYYNAIEQQDKGVAFLLEQKYLNSNSLLESLDTLAGSLDDYKAKLCSLPSNEAASKITNDLLGQIQDRDKQ
jgi:UDP-N-acetylglucosamine--N-acetylmuramyl-(pentapeptide) pyrophosphoryl-undecaprenol N-acetylglucosamine transferase